MPQKSRSENFFEHKFQNAKSRIKDLESDCAELQRENEEMREKVKKLASRTPEWPKGYRPTRRAFNEKKKYEQRK